MNYFVNNVKIDLDKNLVNKIMTVFNDLPIKKIYVMVIFIREIF